MPSEIQFVILIFQFDVSMFRENPGDSFIFAGEYLCSDKRQFKSSKIGWNRIHNFIHMHFSKVL